MMSRFDASDDPEFNPYAAPKTDSKAPIRHYRVVLWRLTYVECWRIAPNPLSFVLLALFKTLRVPVATVSAVTYPTGLDLVDIHEIPAYVLDRWRPALDACPDLGLRTKFCQRVPVLGRAENFNMVLVRDDGEFTVTLTFERYIVQNRERIYVTTNIASRLNDDRRAVTTDNRRAVALLPEIVTQAVTGRSLPEMVAAHRDWLAANALTVIPVPEASLERTILARLQAAFDRNVERGLYVPISERDYEKLAQQSSRGLRPPSRAWQVLSKIEFSLWLVLVAVGVYSIVSGGHLIGGPKLFGADVTVVFFGLFVLALLVGAIRSLVARSRA
jgi:hypothetical protein